ncbi:MAG: M48 family metallopeptidase [Balneolaceae bacterium]
MNFFEAQERAKKKTVQLVILYIIAVVLMIVSVYVALVLLLNFGTAMPVGWHPALFTGVAGITLLLIISGTLFRVAQLRKGGSAVAELLGGRRVNVSTDDLKERQLINVVEEMAIASGTPMPDLYILDHEENINAFAAGFGTDDAAIGVTRGTLEKLSRDELQGVIAHEFSHVLNGDMRLNIRLIGILNGILLIHMMGLLLMRSVVYSGGMRRRSSSGGSGNSGNATLVIILFGLSLIVIGYIGMLFGRVIQAAVSRQREYLADAAAVQYTRNPDGIAGALQRIKRIAKGSDIQDAHAVECSHLFFASSFSTALNALFATHPPLDKRIEAIRGAVPPPEQPLTKKSAAAGPVPSSPKTEAGRHATGPLADTLPLREILLASIGTIATSGVERARSLLSHIPDELHKAAHEPLAAEAVAYGLILCQSESSEADKKALATNLLSPDIAGEVERLYPLLDTLEERYALPLAELSIPALRQMSDSQYGQFRQILRNLIDQDERVSLFEFALEKLIEHRLDAHFKRSEMSEVRHFRLKPMGNELSVILSTLAHACETDTQQAWESAVASLGKAAPDNLELLPPADSFPGLLDGAIDEFAHAANPVKKALLNAMAHGVMSDDRLSMNEYMLLKAIAESIGTPIPLHVMPAEENL